MCSPPPLGTTSLLSAFKAFERDTRLRVHIKGQLREEGGVSPSAKHALLSPPL